MSYTGSEKDRFAQNISAIPETPDRKALQHDLITYFNITTSPCTHSINILTLKYTISFCFFYLMLVFEIFRKLHIKQHVKLITSALVSTKGAKAKQQIESRTPNLPYSSFYYTNSMLDCTLQRALETQNLIHAFWRYRL